MFTLGRMIDFNYKPNKLIILFSSLTVLLGWGVTGSLLSGVYIGVSVFLTWALTREVDPKHDYSALIAAVFSLLNLFQYESFQLLDIAWILLFMRLVNRLSGEIPTTFDILGLLALTIYLSISMQNSSYFIIYFLALVANRRNREKKVDLILAGIIGLGFFLVESFFLGYLFGHLPNQLNWIYILIVLALVLSFLLYWLLTKVRVTDDKGNIVAPARILTCQTMYSLAVLLLLLFGEMTWNNLIVYLSVLGGIAVYQMGLRVFNLNKKN